MSTATIANNRRPPPLSLYNPTVGQEDSGYCFCDMSEEDGIYPVSSLAICCVRVICNNINSFTSFGNIPYHIIKPVLKDRRCTADILRRFEQATPHLKVEDQEIWQHKCFDEFPGLREQYDQGKTTHITSWRKFYIQCQYEHEEKINKIGSRMRERRDRTDAQKKERSTILINKAPPTKKAHWSVATAGWASTKPKSLLDKARIQTKKATSVYSAPQPTGSSSKSFGASTSMFISRPPVRTHPYASSSALPSSSRPLSTLPAVHKQQSGGNNSSRPGSINQPGPGSLSAPSIRKPQSRFQTAVGGPTSSTQRI